MLRAGLRSAVLFILALTVGSAAPGFAKSKDFNQTYPLQPGGSFESRSSIRFAFHTARASNTSAQ